MKTIKVTKKLKDDVTELLSLAQRVIDLQYDDDIADELEAVLVSVAKEFGIETTEVNVDVSEDGKTYTITHNEPEEPDFPGWTPKLILGDKDKDKDPEIH